MGKKGFVYIIKALNMRTAFLISEFSKNIKNKNNKLKNVLCVKQYTGHILL